MRMSRIAWIAGLLAACSREGTKSEKPVVASKPVATPAVSAVKTPAAPAAPVYSAAAAAELLTKMETCEYDFSCDSFEKLIAFGTPAAEGLAKLATDAAKPAKARGVAAKALLQVQDPNVGPSL